MATAVKERPILMSAEMVRAILDGRKGQTRRVVKPQPPKETQLFVAVRDWFEAADIDQELGFDFPTSQHQYHCPYGVPGGRLWVRETWCEFVERHRTKRNIREFAYRANCHEDGERCRQDYIDAGYPYQWKPSIHMPRIASRLLLELTNVRVERLQDISDEDAAAEGVDAMPSAPAALTHRTSFAKLWDTLNKSPDYSWESNPWVWVLDFKRVED